MCLSTHIAKMMKGFAAIISGFIHLWIAELRNSEKRFPEISEEAKSLTGRRGASAIGTGTIFISSKLQPRSRAGVKTYRKAVLEKARVRGRRYYGRGEAIASAGS